MIDNAYDRIAQASILYQSQPITHHEIASFSGGAELPAGVALVVNSSLFSFVTLQIGIGIIG
ncbi:hypothetical protein ASE07_11545 [Noviherbaspirillum sp. Root189]|nr:hypothetical protein ASE07_11545 [Noviherbaspirillum sp. Root189]